MAGILKPFSNIVVPGKLQVPSGQLSIDWTNSLSNGLIACWLPGVSLLDLVDGLVLVPESAASLAGTTADGIGFSSQAANTGAATSGTLPSIFTSWTALTLRWRGYITTNLAAFADFIGITYDNTGAASPFYVAGVRTNTASAVYTPLWNSGGTFSNFNSSVALATPSFIDIAMVFIVNGTNSFYFNGAFDSSASFGVSAPTSSTSVIDLNVNIAGPTTRFNGGICTIAQIWNRALTAAEVMALYLDPYSVIIPAEYELPIMQPPPPLVFNLMPQIIT